VWVFPWLCLRSGYGGTSPALWAPITTTRKGFGTRRIVFVVRLLLSLFSHTDGDGGICGFWNCQIKQSFPVSHLDLDTGYAYVSVILAAAFPRKEISWGDQVYLYTYDLSFSFQIVLMYALVISRLCVKKCPMTSPETESERSCIIFMIYVWSRAGSSYLHIKIHLFIPLIFCLYLYMETFVLRGYFLGQSSLPESTL